MKISIIVPIYNVKTALLEVALDSLAKQTLRKDEYEIVLVDDASSMAETVACYRQFAKSQYNVVVVCHDENKGLNEARRSGVSASSGDYVVFVDGDDILTRDAIESLRMEAHRSDADIVTAPFYRWNYTNNTYATIPITEEAYDGDYVTRLKLILSKQYSYTMCGRLFRKSLFEEDVFDIPLGLLHEDMVTSVRVLFKLSLIHI